MVRNFKFMGRQYWLKSGPNAEELTELISPTKVELESLEASLKPGDKVLRISRLEYVVVRP